MKTSTASASTRRSLPMPLWMQGFLELILTTLFSYLSVAVIIAAIWSNNGFGSQNFWGVLQFSGNIWLLIHGVSLNLAVPAQGSVAAVSGTMSYIPLGLTLIPLFLTFRSGRRLARASYEGQFWIPLVGGLLGYALVSGVLSKFSSGAVTSTSLVSACLVPCWVAALGVIAGGLYESRSLSGMIGVNAADNVRRFSQYSRWAGSYVWALVRASFIAPLGLLAGGALLAGFSIFYGWDRVLEIYQRLHAGAVGDTAITFLQLGILPNLVVYSMSYSTGAGFALGQGSSVGWDGAQVGSLPLLPLLGSVPTATAPWSYCTLAVPVIAGVLAGWWFFREGEDHLDEWLSLKIRFRPLSWTLSHLALALMMGALSGVWVGLLGWVSRGSLGLGKFTDIGADPLMLGVLAAMWFAAGIFCGALFGRLFERDAKVTLARETDDVRLSKNATETESDVEEPAQKKKKSLRLWGGLGKKKLRLAEAAGDDASSDEEQASSASAEALKQILDDENSEESTDEVTAEENTSADSERPWWEKHTLIRYPKAAEEKKTEEPEAENSPADETSAGKGEKSPVAQSPKLKTPRLSRGTVIRRPKAKRKESTDDE